MPRVTKKSIFADNQTKKPTKLAKFTPVEPEDETKCLTCGKVYKKKKGNFSPSRSPFFAYNDSYLPICRDCMFKTLMHYYDVLCDPEAAFDRVCMHWDLYFSHDLYRIARHDKGIEALLGGYFSAMNGTQYMRKDGTYKTYDDTLEEMYEEKKAEQERKNNEKIEAARLEIAREAVAEAERIRKEKEELERQEEEQKQEEERKRKEEEEEENQPFIIEDAKDIEEARESKELKISPKLIKFWGYGYELDEYKWMDDEYTSWVIRANNGETPSKSLENALKEMCKTYIDIKRARRSGAKAGEISSLQTTYLKYMEKAGLSPDQEDNTNIAEKNALGVLIDVWENDEPVPKYPKENIIKTYIQNWFKGHLARCANLKNDTEEEYKAELDKYKIKILEDESVYEMPPVTIEDGDENG